MNGPITAGDPAGPGVVGVDEQDGRSGLLTKIAMRALSRPQQPLVENGLGDTPAVDVNGVDELVRADSDVGFPAQLVADRGGLFGLRRTDVFEFACAVVRADAVTGRGRR